MMDTVRTSETSVIFYETTGLNMSEASRLWKVFYLFAVGSGTVITLSALHNF
jgi:hypothetical protein